VPQGDAVKGGPALPTVAAEGLALGPAHMAVEREAARMQAAG
jgi:hypothetical protein